LKAEIKAIRKDGKALGLREPICLKFHRGQGIELATMSPNTPELLDVLGIEHTTGTLMLALGWNYTAFDVDCCNDPGHTYEIDVSISSSIVPTDFTFILPALTGDFGATSPDMKLPC